MPYEYRAKKTVIVLDEKLAIGDAMNALGHLAIAIGAHADRDDLMGRLELPDQSGMVHRGISKYPCIILCGNRTKIRAAIETVRTTPNLIVVDFPQEMKTTSHDDELASALAGTPEAALSYWGFALYGATDSVNTICKKFSLWK